MKCDNENCSEIRSPKEKFETGAEKTRILKIVGSGAM